MQWTLFAYVSLYSCARVFLGYLPENKITGSKAVSSSSLLDFVKLLCKSTEVHLVGWILTAGHFSKRNDAYQTCRYWRQGVVSAQVSLTQQWFMLRHERKYELLGAGGDFLLSLPSFAHALPILGYLTKELIYSPRQLLHCLGWEGAETEVADISSSLALSTTCREGTGLQGVRSAGASCQLVQGWDQR